MKKLLVVGLLVCSLFSIGAGFAAVGPITEQPTYEARGIPTIH